jgi:D-arabinose 1-dehydrogenase-like Zn-dependent alcohol dehydrogenase
VGTSVTLFKPGDRVLGYSNSFMTGLNKDGAFQTYTIVSQELAAKLPDAISFEDGAALPLAVGTATISLFDNLGLPLPTTTSKSGKKQGSAILIWSGASSVGSVAIQMAALAGYTVFATASETHHEYLKNLGATEVFDYRSPTVASDLVSAATTAAKPITYALDTFSDTLSTTLILEILSKSGGKGSKLAHLLPWPESQMKQDGIAISNVSGENIFGNNELSTWAYGKFLTEALESGSFVSTPKVQAVDGGLDGLQAAMDLLKSGVSGTKLVVKVE